MEFKVGDYTVDVEILNKSVFKSKHTNNDLKKLEISYKTKNEIPIPNTVKSVSDGKKWKVGATTHSYTEGNPLKSYKLGLEEIEMLNIEKLIIDGLELEPYEYDEKAESDGIQIEAKLKLNIETWQKILDIIDEKRYFNVIRQGISDIEKKMRFGQILYSEKNEKIKCRLIIVEKSDTSDKYGFLDPYMPNIKANIIRSLTGNKELLSILSEKGVITNSDVERIEIAENEKVDKLSNYTLLYNVVKDLDEFLKNFY